MARRNKPNILIIQSDQHAATTIGCYGDRYVKTKNLDSIAANGIRFTNCVSNNPVCGPFRATMMTGLHSHTHGTVHNLIPLDTRLPTMAAILREAEYITGYAGKWHLGRWSRAISLEQRNVRTSARASWQFWRGYERALNHIRVLDFCDGNIVGASPGWEPAWLTNIGIEFIRSNKNHPWIFYLSVSAPHPPPQCPREFSNLYKPNLITPPVPDLIPDKLLPAYQQMMRTYYGQVSAIDFEIGRLLEFLRNTELLENTIIIYTSDHGDRLGHHHNYRAGALRGKGGPFLSEFQIPLLIQWPLRIPAGLICEALIDSVDLLPTILDLAGINLLGIFQGQSMAQWCWGHEGPQKSAVYLEHGFRRGSWRGIWDGQFVYSPSLNIMYNHSLDPHELENIYTDPASKDEKTRLQAELILLANQLRDPHAKRIEAIQCRT